jgi:hypothetical protein
MNPALDEELAAFIGASLGSVWALELLLLLRRSQPRRWTEEELVTEMRASSPLVAEAMVGLQRAGLINCNSEGCAYAPASEVIATTCDRLEAAYKNKPVTVVNAILATPKGKLQTFADAFRVKGGGTTK